MRSFHVVRRRVLGVDSIVLNKNVLFCMLLEVFTDSGDESGVCELEFDWIIQSSEDAFAVGVVSWYELVLKTVPAAD